MPYAIKAKAEGKKVLHLNIGQPDIKTPEVVLEKMRNLTQEVIEYSPSDGFMTYREKLAAYYQSKGMPVKPEEILITTGGSEALIFAMLTCFDIGDEVIIPEPYYANYSGFATIADVHVRPITTTIEEEFALPPAAMFESLITDQTRGIVLCNPGNPTGRLYTRTELEAIAAVAKKFDLYIIADEVYREFCYDGATPISMYSLDGIDDNVILIDSVSKRYSMCGARVGALITRNVQVREAALKFAQARLSPPTFGQIAAEAALETPQSYFDDVTREYVTRRDFTVSELNKIPGVFCPMPSGAFYCIAKLPIDNSDKFCQWLLESFSIANTTIMLAPATGFYISRGLGAQEVRIAYVLNKKDLATAINILAKALEVYPGRVAETSDILSSSL
jgi:aspartate aminotransferase